MFPFGCSGPGAPAAIGRSIEAGYTHAEVLGGLVILSLLLLAIRARRWPFPAGLLVLLALHPAWTVSAISGDCGAAKVLLSCIFTALGCVALLWQAGRLVWTRFCSGGAGRSR